MSPVPPRLASSLLRLAAHRDDRHFILDDAREEFERIAGGEGIRAANTWYWRQAWSSVRPLAQRRTTVALRARARRPRMPRGLAADLSQGVRFIRRNPWTAVTVVVTLTVALAASIATWSIVHDAVIAPLPFPSANQIVAVRVTGPTIARSVRTSSTPNFEDWREQAKSFEALAAWATLDFRMVDRGTPRQVQGLRVTRGYDRVLGVKPALGRVFVDADYLPVPRVAVLTHRFWASEFSSNPAAIGQFLELDDKSYEIVGVSRRPTSTIRSTRTTSGRRSSPARARSGKAAANPDGSRSSDGCGPARRWARPRPNSRPLRGRAPNSTPLTAARPMPSSRRSGIKSWDR